MDIQSKLAETVRVIASKGWAPATSGNYSFLLQREPLRMLMTPSGVDKSGIAPEQLIEVDGDARVVAGFGDASAESLLHRAVYSHGFSGSKPAACVLHTHSVWNTLLSSKPGELRLAGYEILKALEGNDSHKVTETLPVFENSQDIPALAHEVGTYLKNGPKTKGFLLSSHGLYTWGHDLFSATRHLQALEFMLEIEGRKLYGPA